MVSKSYLLLLVLVVPLTVVVLSYLDREEFFSSTETAEQQETDRLNAAIFKIGGVTDHSLVNVNLAVLDYFMAENKPLSVEVVVRDFGNAERHGLIFKKVEEGYDAGLFEVGIHGFSGGTTFDTLDYETQLQHLRFANGKLTRLLGSPSQLFVPPLGKFNSDTIRAMANSDPPITIFSARNQSEDMTPNPYKLNSTYDTGRGIVEVSDVNGTKVYHLRHDISFQSFEAMNHTGDSLRDAIVQRAEINIEKYGYAIIVLHPTDFCVIDELTGRCTDQIDPERFKILADTVDELESSGYRFAKIGDVI